MSPSDEKSRKEHESDEREAQAADLSSIPDDPRLIRAVEEYLHELESGKRPDRGEYLARYPDLAEALGECLDGLELVRQIIPGPELCPTDGLPFLAAAGQVQPANPLGDFQIVCEIGRGGMGIVYEAIQLSLGRRVALKVLPLAATFDNRQLQRFRHEAQAAAQLHHTNIVPVYAVGCERGIHFYAMQLIDGQSLDGVIRQLKEQGNGSLPASAVHREGETAKQLSTMLSTQRNSGEREFYRFVARAMAQAAEAIEYAHQQGVIHRDLKPANLLVDSRGMIWITDFGLAHFHADAGLTQTGDILGTVRYMSPEQASGERLVLDHRTDIYSLGATFYELLTLQPVFSGATREALLHQVLNQEPRLPRAVDRRIPVELETILLKTLSKSPADRYASAQALADDLHRFLRDEPIQAKRPSPLEYARKWVRRHPALIAAAVATMFVILLVSLVANWRITQANNRTNAALKQERIRAEEAERRFAQARQVVDLLIEVCEKDLPDRPPFQSLRKRLLETALVYYQDFISERADQPSSQAELIAVRERLTKILDDLSVLEGAGQLVMLGKEKVQDELGLSETQRRQLQTITRDVNERRLNSLRDFTHLSPSDRSERFVQWARTNEQVMRETLTPEQLKRLGQITLQLQGTMAFSQPAVVAQLQLTEEQKQAIRQIEMQAFGSMGEFFQGRGKGRGRQPAAPEFRENLLRTSVAQAVAVLTPEQRTIWAEMTGEPFHQRPSHDHPPHGEPAR